MSRPRPLTLSLLLSLGLGLAMACDIEDPPPSLRLQMFKVDASMKVITGSFGHTSTYPKVAENARLIANFAVDPAFRRYEGKPSYTLRPEDLETFRAFQVDLRDRAEALETAALAVDEAGVRAATTQLQSLCTTCHGKFRPGL
ncbi:MAG: hypothetical protein ACI8QS_000901 [Planctomycetota bacterium]|jgi:hypothetical protein